MCLVGIATDGHSTVRIDSLHNFHREHLVEKYLDVMKTVLRIVNYIREITCEKS